MTYFIPPKRDDYRAFLLEIKTEIAVVGPSFGLDAAAILAVQTTCQNQIALIDAAKLAEDAAVVATKTETDQRVITNAALQEEIAKWKTATGWSAAAATALHVKSSAGPAFVPDAYKPVFSVKAMAGGPRLKWPKNGADSMEVRSSALNPDRSGRWEPDTEFSCFCRHS